MHVTLSREAFGPDVVASVTTSELQQLTAGIRFVERAYSCPVNKDQVAVDLTSMRSLFTKSVVTRKDLPAGTVLVQADLALKKPGTGIPGDRLHEVVGRRIKRSLKADELLNEEDFGD